MKTQDEINKLWLQSYSSPVGTIVQLVPPTRTVPGLRKPYQYELPAPTIAALKATLRVVVHPYKLLLQCELVEFKALAHGVRLNLFLLGYRPGFCGDPSKGITAAQWDICTQSVRVVLDDALGEDTPVYVEPWNPDAKFQARFETYIKRS
jgi:hypothetical protein